MTLVDNHHINNVVFGVIGTDGISPVPASAWDRIREVRDAVLLAIEELAPAHKSFVFTNVLLADAPEDRAFPVRIEALAATRAARYVPVHLHATTEVITARVDTPDRRARMKWIDPDGVRSLIATSPILRVDHPCATDVDVTGATPPEVAAAVLDHLDHLDALDRFGDGA